MKKIKSRSIFLFIITIVLFYYVLKDNFKESINLLLDLNLVYLLLIFFVYFIYFIIETYLLYLLINKVNNSYSYFETLKLNLMTKFFNGITLFLLGGQPLEVYQLSKSKVRVTEALLITVENNIILYISMTLLSLFCFFFCIYNKIIPNKLLWVLTIFSMIIILVILFISVIMGFKEKLSKNIGKYLINFLYKVHLIKDKDSSYLLWTNKCDEYRLGFEILLKDKFFIIKCTLLNIIYLILFSIIPFLIFKLLNVSVNVNILFTLVISYFVYLSVFFIPLPGATIGIEYSFINYFNLILNDNIVLIECLLWRLITYYIPMIIGGILFNLDEMCINKK